MHLKWPWLLRFFAKMLQKQFKLKIIEIEEIQIASTAFSQRNAIATAILNTYKNIKLYLGIVSVLSLCVHPKIVLSFYVHLTLCYEDK